MNKKQIKKYKCCICGKVTAGRKPNTLKLKVAGVMWPWRHSNYGQVCNGTWMQAEVVEVEFEVIHKPKARPSMNAEDVREWT